ncbi:MAG: nucleoside-diphosphate sugar epimerase [candidate division Zixibacteria bacterium CG_4_9_14_3_um_filter_46_8]|nr:MAG: nucleoside-diphosphate sugar epimerase [candidate division Zixibacteria bacterium CG_4_9_14_3_um_filter_46_8]
MHSLITGGAGFVGSHLTEYLLQKDEKVTIVDNLSTGKFDNVKHLTQNRSLKIHIDTILNEPLMEHLIKECDVIYHLAAAVGVRLIIERPVETIETNIIGTEEMLKLANRYKKKTLITSTSEVYGKANKIPFAEDDDSVFGPTVKSRWCYACSKAMDEYLALAYYHEKKLPMVIARLFNTIGARQTGQYGMVVPTFVQQALLNHPITVYDDGQQSRSFTNVHDVVWALYALMNDPNAVGQVFNIGNGQEITIYGLAELIKEMTGSSSEIQLIPYDQAFESGFEDMRRRVPDITKLSELTGYEPKMDLRESIKQIIEYYKK